MDGLPSGFREWACSFSGCDGGNPDADIWLSGIEWGGDGGEDYYERRLPDEVSRGAVELKTDPYCWEQHNRYKFGKSTAKLVAAIHGYSVERYQELFQDGIWNGSEIFKLNLYPIAFTSTDPKLWSKTKMDKYTGFKDKNLYQLWCNFNRFPAFAEHRNKQSPKLVIGVGVSYLREFVTCFGGAKVPVNRIDFFEIEPRSERNKRTARRRVYWVKVAPTTMLVVIPFYTGSYGLNSNYLLETAGRKIADRCRENGISIGG